jgi:peptidoglycan/LPS O-acetylase OafA/YrhL
LDNPPVPPRSNNFDALRLLGALLVFYSHQFALTGHKEPMVHAPTGTAFGSTGVYIFFAISGFLVCQSWLRDPSAWRFAQRRFLRIWPGMTAAIVLTSVSLFAFTQASLEVLLKYLGNVVCLGCSKGLFFPDNAYQTLYGSMWSIPVEVQCYALLLTAGVLFRRRLAAFITCLAAAAMLMPIARHVLPPELLIDMILAGWIWPSWITCGAFFLAACMLCIHPQLLQRAWLPILGGVLLMARGEFIVGLVFALPAAVVWVGSQSWPVLRSAGRFGDLSYGIYLWAWPVQQVLVMLLGDSLSTWAHMAIALPITFACALASWHLIERPALRLKPRSQGSSQDFVGSLADRASGHVGSAGTCGPLCQAEPSAASTTTSQFTDR